MPSNGIVPSITESQILNSYLLPPSPLPTVLPYSSFLTLVPSTYRNDPAYAAAIKRLYRDLQFQRAVTVDQVRENIEKECGERAATLRANLTRRIAIEEGDRQAEREEIRLQRKRKRESVSLNQAEADQDGEAETEDEELSSDTDELNDPLHLAAHQTMYDDPSSLHPAAHVLPLVGEERFPYQDQAAFHTRESLLLAMENGCNSLQTEIEELEAECGRLKESIGDTIGGLSDLRYGRRQSDGDQNNEYREVLEAMEQFRGIIKTKLVA